MSYIDDYKKRKEHALEYSEVLGREIKPNQIRIKNDIVSCAGLSSEESDFMLAYLRNKWSNMGYKIKENDPKFDAECDAMWSVKH